jgi:thiol-disulfide isomerase/thioredoxin
MKTQILFLVSLFLTLSACQPNEKVFITGELVGYKKSTPILYSVMPFRTVPDKTDTIFADDNGRFSIELKIDKPQLIFFYGKQDSAYFYCPALLIKSGENHFVNFSLTKDISNNESYSVKGPNSEGQKILFSSFDNGWRGSNLFTDQWNLNDSTIIKDSLARKIERTLLPFQQLLSTKKIDKDFYKYANNNIRYYFAYQLENEIEDLFVKKNDLPQKEQLEIISTKIFSDFPISGDDILNSSVLTDYLYFYLAHLKRMNKTEYDSFSSKGLAQTYELNELKEVVTPEVYRYYAIEYIWSRAGWKDKETLDLFDQYKKDYPNYTSSYYYKKLEKESIPAILELYSRNTDQLPPETVILDNEKPILSFKELIANFPGKPIFIDCWATWCGPCIGDFQYNEPLKQFLKNNKIEMVYIAYEKTQNTEKWKAFINEYNLIGSHLMANDSIKKDLLRNLGIEQSDLRIPKYILINKNGQIVLKDALRPSDEEKLLDQIRMTLKL